MVQRNNTILEHVVCSHTHCTVVLPETDIEWQTVWSQTWHCLKLIADSNTGQNLVVFYMIIARRTGQLLPGLEIIQCNSLHFGFWSRCPCPVSDYKWAVITKNKYSKYSKTNEIVYFEHRTTYYVKGPISAVIQ